MLKTLRRKFVWITMAVAVIMLTVIFALLYSSTKAELENQSYHTLQTIAQAVSGLNGFSELPGDLEVPWFVLQLRRDGHITAVGYTRHDLTDERFLQSLVQAVAAGSASAGVLERVELMYQTVPGMPGTVAFLDISGYNDSLGALIESCVVIGVLSLAAFWAVSFFLARWAVRPVERAWEQQKQFVSDASHELKTPLTVIMSSAELLEASDTLGEHRRYVHGILEMSRQMRGLVEGLLELARADNGQVKRAFATLDMSRLVSDALLPFEPVLYEQGLSLETAVEPDVWVNGSAGYLKQVVEILLDNAAKYSAPGIVTVGLERQGKSCLLSVANPGAPIPPEEQRKIFERFYRADAARSRTGSYGLGLSIAQAVIREHGGRIFVRSNPTGNCFCVQLPLTAIVTPSKSL